MAGASPDPAAEAAPPRRISPAEAGRLMRWATYASSGTALLLIALKLVAWGLTDSVALLSSLVDSLLDGMASLVMLLAVRQSLVPADREHRFGHGKAEPLAALAQAGLITGSALFLLVEAGRRLFDPEPISHGELGVAVMLVSLVATFALTRFQKYVVARTGSVAIRADALHYLSDLMMNAAVILALVLTSRYGLTYADPLLALAIDAYILRSAFGIGLDAYNMLMDRELPDEERQRIIELVRRHSEVLGV
ncbi:MAG: cation diffusion facilitator family transporter, partial [Tistlia sp.]